MTDEGATEDITLASEISVRLIQKMGGDSMVVASAKVSTCGEAAAAFARPESAEANSGLINFLVRNRHGTPAEHSAMTFFVHAPAFVWWEWVRHRVGMTVDCCPEFSFNLESGRYRKLEPVFWIPRRSRPMMTPARGYSPARPSFDEAEDGEYEATIAAMGHAYRAAWSSYRLMTGLGVANEVARAALGFGIYYSGWVTCNPRSLMHFISLRTHDPVAKYVSYPQSEIEEAAHACEAVLAEGWPITHKAFCAHGRVAP